ncbi:MAG: hypothetical protein ACJ8GV_05075 [Luteimonas sp.]
MAIRLRWCALLLAAAALMPGQGRTQDQTGEQGLLWRAGDPFVFCRYGMRHSPRAWYPVADYTRSLPRPSPGYCPVPTTWCYYQRGWTMDEIAAYFTYLRICPQAERSGRWDGAGDGTQAPFSH